MKKYLKFILALVVCFAASAIGSLFTFSAIPTWYATLNKASFNPPNWIFGPVWTLLYFLMAITLYLIWTHKKNVQAERWFYLQLIFNAMWSVVFFGLHQPLTSFIIIVLLFLSIVATMFWTKKTTKTGAYLMVPYLIWIIFAAILNLMVVILN